MPGHTMSATWAHDPTINAPAKHRRACRYDVFIPDKLTGLQFSLESSIAGMVSEAERAISALNASARPALLPLARLLLRTESIASSKVEGMQFGVRDLARAEAKSESGLHVGNSALEILANVDAMELAVHDAALTDAFSVDDILAIHARLMAHAPNARIAGRLRTTQNWIGGNDFTPCGADFVPPPPEMLDALLADLCDAINDDLLPPLVQAALIHAQFETIHPFDDGNGRTGRALVQVVLRRRGTASAYLPPISVVFAGARQRYIAGLTSFRGDEVQQWIEYFAGVTTRASRLAQWYLDAVRALQADWRSMLAENAAPRAGAAAWAVIDVLPAHPMLSAPVAVAATGRAKAAVYQALDQLEQAGVLVPVSASRRNRVWEAHGLLDLVEHMESGGDTRAARS
ncbi:MAG: Fic family protein [Gemmatimonadaceae bacterium]